MNDPALTCAVCGDRVYMDDDHVHVEAETKRINDRDDRDDWYFHPRCFNGVSDGWRQP